MSRSTLCALAAVLAACAGHEHRRHEAYVVDRPGPVREVIIVEEPPPPRAEVIPNAPSRDHVWVAGYWERAGNRWVWVPGCYVARPRPVAIWVAGHWARRPGGWAWIPGHWD